MAYRGPSVVAIEIDNTVGGSLTAITQFVLSISGINKLANLEDSRTFGDTWGEASDIGTRMMEDITIEGFYDDTASTGSHAILDGAGEQRSFRVTFGNSKTVSVEVLIVSYARTLDRAALHKFRVVLRPTGAPTEA